MNLLKLMKSLHKALNGHWSTSGGYNFHSRIAGKDAHNRPYYEMAVTHESSGHHSPFDIDGKGDNSIASALIGHHSDGNYASDVTWVDKEHRRKGLASEMYNQFSKQFGHKMVPATAQSDDAKKLWENKQDLEKAYQFNGNWLPEKSDKGKPHPVNADLVGHIDASGNPAWSHNSEVMGRSVSKIKNNIHKLNMSDMAKNKLAKLILHVMQDPDRGVMTSGTHPNKVGDFSELRIRHLGNALAGHPDYSISEDNGNVVLQAGRHGKSPAVTNWHFDGKTLKSFHKEPIRGTTKEGALDYNQPNKSDAGKKPQNGGNDGRGMGNVRVGVPTVPKGPEKLGKSDGNGKSGAGIKKFNILSKSAQNFLTLLAKSIKIVDK
jgi:hypothetical protein